MSEMNQFISDQLQWFVPGIVLILLVLLILVLVQGGRIRTMRRKYEAMMSGTGIDNLESLLIDLKNQNEMLEEAHGRQEDALKAVQEKLKGMKGQVALKRYNAFGERGNDLSFSLAILDDRRNGIVITNLHSRENSYIYAKPLEQGESSHALSPEEKEVIALALQRT
ncbi:hypothetical protein PSTEL_26865 [Paenibacillus stellifer]|uniref:DUF4446 domain-containing protein n=1 Tax=Paenibacillus stellifer TaxID=169760 RepID=A0A089LXD2_9BACL|nr:DUF4446 family protein [Paenibacillus stellifer]AIQ66196.1 hypothetical protein PSTEL_26865 [Paenibacillus stellifer]